MQFNQLSNHKNIWRHKNSSFCSETVHHSSFKEKEANNHKNKRSRSLFEMSSDENCENVEKQIIIKDEEQEQPPLSEEQLQILTAVQAGQNIFITGSAGVGKSFVLKEVIKALPPKTTFVTASTGVAACNISGITLHSFAGIGLGDSPVATLLRKVRTRREARARWMECEALVIDEISMIDGELFEKIEEIARKIRGSDSPFGGIQLIVCGDFLQLPPVQKKNESKKFCFEVQAWKRCVHTTILLNKVFRQKEEKLIGMLNRIRLGEMILKDNATLQKCNFTKFNQDDGIKPTRLFPHRASCDDVNEKQLAMLSGEKLEYKSSDNGEEIHRQQLDKYSRFPKVISLKVGAQVMLLKNLDVSSGLVNGARGVVTGFVSQKEEQLKGLADDDPELAAEIEDILSREESNNIRYPQVKFTNGCEMVLRREKSSIEIAGKEVASRDQIPLALAWAVSIHKAQGMTLERVELSLGNVFEYGQAYVALSRCTSVSGLKVSDFSSSRVKAHPKVLEYYKNLCGEPFHAKTASTNVARNEAANNRSLKDLKDFGNTSTGSDASRNVGHVPNAIQSGSVKNSYKTPNARNFRGFTQSPSSNRSKLFFNNKTTGNVNGGNAFFQPQKRPRRADFEAEPVSKQQKGNFGNNIVMKPSALKAGIVTEKRENLQTGVGLNKSPIVID